MVNLCANNYLGLADHPEVTAAARAALDRYGFGMASVRFIAARRPCIASSSRDRKTSRQGRRDPVRRLFDANGGVFEPLLEEADAIISDSLNHASIIDGVRLSKAKRYRFANSDMDELETRLKEADAAGARFKLIATEACSRWTATSPSCRKTATSPSGTARWCWSTIATRPAISALREGHARAHRRRRPRRYRHRHVRQDARRRDGRIRRRARSRSSIYCASARGPISSPTAWRRRLRPDR